MNGKTVTVRQRARLYCLKGKARLGSWDLSSKQGLLALRMRLEGEGMGRLEPESQILEEEAESSQGLEGWDWGGVYVPSEVVTA